MAPRQYGPQYRLGGAGVAPPVQAVNYGSQAGAARTAQSRRNIRQGTTAPAFNPRPDFGSRGSGRSGGGSLLEQIKSLPDRQGTTPSSDDGGSWLDKVQGIAGVAGKGLIGAIRVADATRATAQTWGGEVGDALSNFGIIGDNPVTNTLLGNPFQFRGVADEDGNRDQSFNPTEILKAPFDKESLSVGFNDRSPWTDDLPQIVKPAVGFAGDILSDPLTYVTGGTIKAATTGTKAGVAAARTTLATDLAEAFAEKGAKQVLSEGSQKAVVESAGQLGRGALTPKNLAKIGVTPKELAEYGIKADFGYSVGVGKARMAIPGSRRLAQGSENTKGAIKKMFGSRHASKIADDFFKTGEYTYKELQREILSGGANSHKAAQVLANLNLGKGRARAWIGTSLARGADILPGLDRLDDDGVRALTHALEIGDMSHPLVKELDEFYQELAESIGKEGGAIKLWRGPNGERYVPHRPSQAAIEAKESGDQAVIDALEPTAKKTQYFQNERGTDRTIAQINEAWRADGHGFDLLEDDARALLRTYLNEGQKAVMRGAATGDQAVQMGLIRGMDEAVDSKAALDMVDKLAEKELKAARRAGKRQKSAWEKARKEARNERATAKVELSKAQTLLSDTQVAANDAQNKLAVAQDSLRHSQTALEQQKKVVAKAQGARKRAATLQLKRTEEAVAKAQADIDFAQNMFERAEKDLGKHAETLAQAEQVHKTLDEAYQDVLKQREALDADPLVSAATAPDVEELVRVQQIADNTNEQVLKAEGVENVASNTAGWVSAGVETIGDRLTTQITEIDKLIARGTPRAPGRKAYAAGEATYLRELRDRVARVRDLSRNTEGRAWNAIDKLEAQALDAEIEAFKTYQKKVGLKKAADASAATKIGTEFDAGVAALKDTEFQEFIVASTRKGFEELKGSAQGDMQIDSFFENALSKLDAWSNPATRDAAFAEMNKAMRGYKKALNWWKGWAVASPGFVMRNLYSGMFNMYLDDVNPLLAGKFLRFYKQTLGMSDEDIMKWGADKGIGGDELRNLIQARDAGAATGGGQTLAEFDTVLGGRVTKNPVSLRSNSPIPRWARSKGEDVEAALRGGHAYGIIKRGGSLNEAIQRVEKFQFNYTDIGRFDRAAKNVMPFWTFWSRNLGLQAQVFAKRPDKINRSYYNAKRNIEGMDGTDFGTTVPGYIESSMAGIATPFKYVPGMPDGQAFITPDVPSARFPAQLTELLTDPVNEIGSSLSPVIKTPMQIFGNKDLFTGREYKNSLMEVTDEGYGRRKASSPLQVPGVDRVLGLLPGAEFRDGNLYMQDNVEAAVMGVNPLLSRAEGFLPDSDRGRAMLGQKVASFLGLPIRINDEGSIAGAEYGLRKEQEDAYYAAMRKLQFDKAAP